MKFVFMGLNSLKDALMMRFRLPSRNVNIFRDLVILSHPSENSTRRTSTKADANDIKLMTQHFQHLNNVFMREHCLPSGCIDGF